VSYRIAARYFSREFLASNRACSISCKFLVRVFGASFSYEFLAHLSWALSFTLLGVHVYHRRNPNLNIQFSHLWFYTLFHRLTRTAYLCNGCLPWYNVVLTSRVHSSVKYSQQPTFTAAVSCHGGISVLNGQTQATEIDALLYPDLLCGIACPLCCECLTVVSRPLGHISWRHCCSYDTLYIDSYIFSLPDSTFVAFLGRSCVLQIALIIIISHCLSWSKFVNTYPTPATGLTEAYT